MQGHAIDAGRPLVLPDPPPRRLQDVAPVDPIEEGVEPIPRFLLRLAPQFPSQQRDPDGQVGFGHKPLGFPVRDGAAIAQAALLCSDRTMREVRPLCSTGVTPLPCYYEPVRLPADAAPRLWIPASRCSPGARRRVSQDSRRFCRRAPSPATPETRRVRLLVTSPAISGFTTSGRLAVDR